MSIVVKNLAFSYGRRVVLHGVEAQAERGKITAVLGPNAAGKSTLLRCIIGALRPASGCVLIDGEDVASLSPRRLAERIAYVPQRSIVSAEFTARHVVELGRYALPASARRVDEAMERLDLADLADRPYHALSVGQQQRVTLARAVAQLEVDGHLVLDEPASAMDLRHLHACMRVLRQLADDGATVILAMHDLGVAASIADAAWLIDEGRCALTGPVHEVLTLLRLESVFGVGFQWVQTVDQQRWLVAPIRNHTEKAAGG